MSAFAELSISHQSPAASGVRNPASEIHRRGLGTILPASQLGERPAPPVVPWGIAALDTLTGGLPRGSLTEVCGAPSSGRSSVLLAAMAEMTRRQEVCALVDASDSFDPLSAAAAGVDLRRVLWVRCSGGSRQPSAVSRQEDLQFAIGRLSHLSPTAGERWGTPGEQLDKKDRRLRLARVEQALKAADLLLQGGGFGMVAVDFADIPPADARRVPLTSWFRFRRVVENTPTVLLVLEQEPYARSCASLVLRLDARLSATGNQPSAVGHRERQLADWHLAATDEQNHQSQITNRKLLIPHAELLTGLDISVELLRAPSQYKKPAASVRTHVESRSAWCG